MRGGKDDDTLDSGSDQLFGGDGNDLLLFSVLGDGYSGGTGIDTLAISQNVDFTSSAETTADLEILDLRSGSVNSVTLNAADVISFGGTTGESWNSNPLDLMVRGDTGNSADTVHLQSTPGTDFSLQASGVTLSDPVYGGATYDVYGDGARYVAVEQGVTVTT